MSGASRRADSMARGAVETTPSTTITTQRTSKLLKAQLAISMFLMLFGGFSWFLPEGGATGGSVDILRPAGSGARLQVDWLSGATRLLGLPP